MENNNRWYTAGKILSAGLMFGIGLIGVRLMVAAFLDASRPVEPPAGGWGMGALLFFPLIFEGLHELDVPLGLFFGLLAFGAFAVSWGILVEHRRARKFGIFFVGVGVFFYIIFRMLGISSLGGAICLGINIVTLIYLLSSISKRNTDEAKNII